MRMYVYEPGQPGFISAEFVMPEVVWREVVELGGDALESMTPPMSQHGEVLTRDQLLEVQTRRRALLAWEAHDDTALEADYTADRRSSLEHDVKLDADEGCPEAAAMITRGLPDDTEELAKYVHQHVCRKPGLRGLSLV